MDYFKRRARQILIDQANPEDFHYDYGQEGPADEMAYDGAPLPLKICYQQMKNLMKRPAMSYGHAGKDEVPNYMKLTFSASKNVHANSSLLQLSNMLGSMKNLKHADSQMLAMAKASDENLIKSLKQSASNMENSEKKKAIGTSRR